MQFIGMYVWILMHGGCFCMHAGKFIENTIMRKYGVENISKHFISFNTICDGAQVNLITSPIIYIYYI